MLILCSHAVLPIEFDRLISTATKITFLFLSQYTMGSKIYICSLFTILFTFVLLDCLTRRETVVYSYYVVTGIGIRLELREFVIHFMTRQTFSKYQTVDFSLFV